MSTTTNTLARRLLARVVAEPGSFTAAQHADEMGEDKADVQRAAKALRRRGLTAGRAYRLYPFSTVSIYANATQTAVVEMLRYGPRNGQSLAEMTGGIDKGGEVTGGWKRDVRQLFDWGCVSLPACLWPTPKGVEVSNDRD